MRLVVVVEAIPDPKQVRVSQSQGIAVTAGADIIASPGSRDALAAAVELREAQGGEIVAVGVGALAAEDALRQVMAAGADAGYLCADPALAGLDAAAAVTVLTEVLSQLQPFDLVLASAGELGPRLAEALDLPQITEAVGLSVPSPSPPWTGGRGGGVLRARRPVGTGWVEVEATLPALVSVAPNLMRRPAAVTGIAAAYHAPLTVWSLADLGLAADQVKAIVEVRRTFVPPQAKDRLEGTPEGVARQLVQRLRAGGWV
jgi:electron transfer flavoprotein beta subunit